MNHFRRQQRIIIMNPTRGRGTYRGRPRRRNRIRFINTRNPYQNWGNPNVSGNFQQQGNFGTAGNFGTMGNFQRKSHIIKNRFGLAAAYKAMTLEELWKRIQALLTPDEQKQAVQIAKRANQRGYAGWISMALGISVSENRQIFYHLIKFFDQKSS